jgi:hypothetical protein
VVGPRCLPDPDKPAEKPRVAGSFLELAARKIFPVHYYAGGDFMDAHEQSRINAAALGVIEQLRDALKYADGELQRRCVISSKIKDALGVAERFLASGPH